MQMTYEDTMTHLSTIDIEKFTLEVTTGDRNKKMWYSEYENQDDLYVVVSDNSSWGLVSITVFTPNADRTVLHRFNRSIHPKHELDVMKIESIMFDLGGNRDDKADIPAVCIQNLSTLKSESDFFSYILMNNINDITHQNIVDFIEFTDKLYSKWVEQFGEPSLGDEDE